MNGRRRFYFTISVALMGLLLAGCIGSTGLREPPTPEPLPTLEPSPTAAVRVTEAAQIIGTWVTNGGKHQHFNGDGTQQWAHSPGTLETKLENGPEGEFWFEGERLYHTTKRCEDRGIDGPGIYEAHLHDDGSLTFTLVEDRCWDTRSWLTNGTWYPLEK